MILAEVVADRFSAANIVLVLGALGLFVTSVTTCIMQFVAAKERKAARKELAKSDQMTRTQLSSIHSAVNSTLAKSLKATMIYSRWKADSTKLDKDKKIADEAQRDYEEHMEKMKIEEDKEAAFAAGLLKGQEATGK